MVIVVMVAFCSSSFISEFRLLKHSFDRRLLFFDKLNKLHINMMPVHLLMYDNQLIIIRWKVAKPFHGSCFEEN